MLFWLNYKAAYDNWNEQRLALNKDIHMATKEVVDKLPGIQQTSVQAFSTLFLQLTVNDLGICLPITNTSQVSPPPLRSWYRVTVSCPPSFFFCFDVLQCKKSETELLCASNWHNKTIVFFIYFEQ